MELLEREQVLADLSGLLAEAAAGQGRLVLLSGEAGIGKTAVVRRFGAIQAGRVPVLTGTCDHLMSPAPLAPLTDIARAGQPSLARLLADGAGSDQVFPALLDLLTQRDESVIVVIEDAHWADESTLDLLRFVGRRITTTRALVLVTYRDDEHADDDPLRVVIGDLATSDGIRWLTLDALSAAAVQTWARGRHPDPAGLYAMTGGNPFYVSEMLAATPGSLPRTIKDAIWARVSRLSAQGRAAVEAAAVLSAGLDHAVLRAVTATGPGALDECIAKGLLGWNDGWMTFRHS